ncbi:IRF4 (predicted) [Pycnogonum litorale]
MEGFKAPRLRRGPKLIPFLIHCLDNDTHRGLKWVNRDRGAFIMPWKRQGSKSWSEQDSKLFKDWAKLKGKSKEINYPKWKTRVRTALNKMKTVQKERLSSEQMLYTILNINEERRNLEIKFYDYSLPTVDISSDEKSQENQRQDRLTWPSYENCLDFENVDMAFEVENRTQNYFPEQRLPSVSTLPRCLINASDFCNDFNTESDLNFLELDHHFESLYSKF